MRITTRTLTVYSAEKITERTDEAGAEEARGSVDSPNYDTTNHAHAKKIAKRSGDTERRAHTQKVTKSSGGAERRRNGGFGVLPRLL